MKASSAAILDTLGVEKLVPTFLYIFPSKPNDGTPLITNFPLSTPALPP